MTATLSLRSLSDAFARLLPLAPLAAAAQMPKPPSPPGLPKPPDPIEVVRKFFQLEPPKLEALRAKTRQPDVDLPNALWIAHEARLAPDAVLQARLEGQSWLAIFVRFQVPLESVIIVDDRARCGPYGKARAYRRNRARRGAELRLTDAEISEFIELRATASLYHETPEALAYRRCSGDDLDEIIREEDESEREHRNGQGEDHHENHEQHGEHRHSRDRDHDHDQDNDNDNDNDHDHDHDHNHEQRGDNDRD